MGLLRAICLSTVCNFILFAATDKVSTPVNARQVRVLGGNLIQGERTADDRGPVLTSLPLSYLSVMLKPDPSVEAFLVEQQTPASPNFHKWLTPDEFGARFGASLKDREAVAAWLRSQGLTVHDVASGGLWVTFSGTAAAVGQVLHTSFHHYRFQGKLHYAAVAEPSIPEALVPVIAGFQGLDDFEDEPALRVSKVHAAEEQPTFTSGSAHYLAPDDIATIYNAAQLYNAGFDGTGQKVAVIGRTAVNLDDMRSFRTRYGLPPNDPQLVLVGPDPGTLSGDEIEADLDLQWSGAVARNATILYVYSNNVRTSAQYAVDRNLAPVMSYSYGACEPLSSTGFRGVAQQANAQGISWMVSSGDNGAATCDNSAPTPQAAKGNTVSFPSSFPEVTSVGGTQFDEGSGTYWSPTNSAAGGSALSYIPERAWNNSAARNQLSAGGGGASVYFPKPVWQNGPGVPNDNARDVPDVSFSASPDHDGYLLINGGNRLVVGGTSAGTPVFAGMAALLNHYLSGKGEAGGLGNLNPTLYRMAQTNAGVFHDTVNGDNKVPCVQSSPGCVEGLTGYSAGPGYDLATGLGSLDIYKLATEWNRGAGSTVTLTSAPAGALLSGTVQLMATIKGLGSGAVPTGTVSFLANDTVLGSAPVNASGVAVLSVAATLIAAGNGTVGALYSGDMVYLASGAAVPVDVTLPQTTGTAVVAFISPIPVVQTGAVWPYTITLREKNGVAATLTEFSIDGRQQSLSLFPATAIPANGTLSTSLQSSGLQPPQDRAFHFAGTDSKGGVWTADFTVTFVGPVGQSIAPSGLLIALPTTVQQNPQGPADCQWQNRVTITEESGFSVNLTRFTLGATDLTGSIPQLFGTTRLAPYGTLQATVCSGGLAVPVTRSFQITGLTELGSSVAVSASVNFVGPAPAPAQFSVLQRPNAVSGSIINLQFTGGSPTWTATVVGSKAATKWLTVSPASGNGSGTITLQRSDAGLSKGVYSAVVSIQAVDSLPQLIEVPVTFTVGASDAIAIAGVTNAASFGTTLAPGAIMSVFGTGLAGQTLSAPRLPLPLLLGGVSATVNGVTAPVYFTSAGQLNVQVPYETTGGTAVIGVNNNGAVASFSFPVSPVAPGIFAAADKSLVPANTGSAGQVLLAFITGDGDVTPTLATGATPAASTAVSRLPQPRQSVTLTVGGVPAALAFTGIPSGLAGATQINFTVPAGLAAGPQPVVVTVGGVASTPVTLTVK